MHSVYYVSDAIKGGSLGECPGVTAPGDDARVVDWYISVDELRGTRAPRAVPYVIGDDFRMTAVLYRRHLGTPVFLPQCFPAMQALYEGDSYAFLDHTEEFDWADLHLGWLPFDPEEPARMTYVHSVEAKYPLSSEQWVFLRHLAGNNMSPRKFADKLRRAVSWVRDLLPWRPHRMARE